MPGHTASGGRGFPVTTFRVSPLEHLKPLLNLKKKTKNYLWVVSLNAKKTQKKLQPPVLLAHMKLLSQNPGTGTKSWYQSKERQKERERGRREGRRRESEGANMNGLTLFLPSSKVGRETDWVPTALHAHRMKKHWFVWQKVSRSIFFLNRTPHPSKHLFRKSECRRRDTKC